VSIPPENTFAVVLAGGFGTRVQHLLSNLPKPMAPVLGKPFVEWVVRYLAKQGLRRVVLATGHLAETVERHFANQPVDGVNVRCAAETRPLGTAGGFLNAIRSETETPAAWLVLNGDSLALTPLASTLLTAGAGSDRHGAMLGLPMADSSRYGTILQNSDGMLIGFKEKQPGAGLINAGVYLFQTPLVDNFPRREALSFETVVFPALIERKAQLKVCVTRAPFLDIGTPESLAQAETFVRQHQDWFA
jgi:D-glycero-alpha-D-manno-heptose 1-phosphate guanylyltransferase